MSDPNQINPENRITPLFDVPNCFYPPENRFIGDIEDGMAYPYACYTKEESDERYAVKQAETEINELNERIDDVAVEQQRLANIMIKTLASYRIESDEDDTEAFRRYFEEVRTGARISLLISQDIVEVSETITIPSNTYFSIYGTGINTNVIFKGQNYMFLVTPTRETNIYLAGSISNLSFRDESGGSVFIHYENMYSSYFNISSCRFVDWDYVAIFDKAYGFTFRDCDVLNGQNGLKLSSANACRISNCNFRYISGIGITFFGTPSSSGVQITNTVFEKMETGIILEGNLYGSSINNCYFEPNSNKPSIVAEDGGFLRCNISNCYMRIDCPIILSKCRSTMFSGGLMNVILPSEYTEDIREVLFVGFDFTFAGVLNYKLYQGKVNFLSYGDNPYFKGYNEFTANLPFNYYKDSVTVNYENPEILFEVKAIYAFELINWQCNDQWQGILQIYDGDELLFESDGNYATDGNMYNPLYIYPEPLYSEKTFTIKLKSKEQLFDKEFKHIFVNYFSRRRYAT